MKLSHLKQIETPDIDLTEVSAAVQKTPLWKMAKSTMSRIGETLDNTTKAIRETVKTEADSGIQVVRNTIAIKAANDELIRDLNIAKSPLGNSAAISQDQLEQLQVLAETAHESIKEQAEAKLDQVLLANNTTSTTRADVRAALETLSEESLNETTKLRMDIKAARAEFERLNRAGHPVDVEAVFEQVRATESNPNTDRSRIVSYIAGSGQQDIPSTTTPEIVVTPNTSTSMATAEAIPASETISVPPDYTVLKSELTETSQEGLRRIARAINKINKPKGAPTIPGINRKGNRSVLLAVLSKDDMLAVIDDNNLTETEKPAVVAA